MVGIFVGYVFKFVGSCECVLCLIMVKVGSFWCVDFLCNVVVMCGMMLEEILWMFCCCFDGCLFVVLVLV